jgi:hypothetical protein
MNMTLTQHTVLTGIAVAAFSPFMGGSELLVFAAGGILFDVDHYFVYIRRKGKYDVRGMFQYFAELDKICQDVPYVGVCLFHTIDFFILVAIGACFFPILLPLLYGLLFHFALDLVDLLRKGCPFIRAYFLVEHLIRRRKAGYPFY